jgi:hypothetical protein
MGLPNGNGNAAIDAWLSRYAETNGRHAAAGWGALLAAWRCEARGDHDDASRCRERAIEFWELALGEGDPITRIGGAADQLTRAETLRRLGQFEEARNSCHRGLSGRPADPIRSVLEFEIELLSAEDTEPHAVAEVLSRGL